MTSRHFSRLILSGQPAAAMSGSAPSTATVLEFRCLFTHDLRRKQKRWQDGRLKYHSFNARVMVYDERGNSVGDMHWHGDYDFGEGEEVQLERGGVIVQVEELVERRETDLSELVDKRLQEKQQRQIQQLARSAAPSAMLPRPLHRPPALVPDRVQPPRHRPLHHVIGTPTGHHGKALVPKESPFEQRQQAAESPDDRAAKRRRYEDPPPSKSGYASALFGQTLTLSATPSSSLSAIRRPRPEPRSDPPADADTQDAREDARPVRLGQPQSSRRLNQSGYAQSLFGQTLTLSHTPVSSVPPRTQPRNDSATSPILDGSRQDSPEAVQPLPPQQPIESHHLDQPGSKPRSALPSTKRRMGRGLAKDSTEIEVSNQYPSVPLRHHAANTVRTVPGDIDVIEIDDPEPVVPRPLPKPMIQKITPAGQRNQDENADSSSMGMGQNPVLHEGSSRTRKQQMLEHERGSKSKKAKGREKFREPEPAVSKTNAKAASSANMEPVIHEDVSRVPGVTRDPAPPVIELRIKSSKKRGLLMISDTSKAKKTRRQVAADSGRALEGSSRHHTRDTDDDDPFQSPLPRSESRLGNDRGIGKLAKPSTTESGHILSDGDDDNDYMEYPVLNRNGEWENEEAMNELGKKCAQRTVSAELGEDDDPFRSPPPAIVRPEPAARDNDTQWRREEAEQADTTGRNMPDPGFSNGGVTEPAGAGHPMRRLSSPPRAGYDPYRIPSSPLASSPASSSSSRRKGRGNDVADEILRPVDNNKKLTKAKQQRIGRRKIISDEDDEDDCEPPDPLPKRSEAEISAEQVVPSELSADASKEQSNSGGATSLKTNARKEASVINSGDEQLRKAARKTRGQGKDMESEEGELPTKRRKSTRQRRSRATSYEEPPLLSEQDDSEEEIPRKRRKSKTSKASEDRPRLEKIKKNVKSRELVGFNLAALNAPLGLRGIGIPFSILPSPVNESIQSRASSRAAVDETEGPVLADRDDDQMSSPSLNPPVAPLKTNATTQQKTTPTTSNRQAPYGVKLGTSESHVLRNESLEEDLSDGLVESGELRSRELPKIRGSNRSDEPGTSPRSSAKSRTERTADNVSSSQQAGAPQQPAPSKPRLETPHHAEAPAPLDVATASERTLPSLNRFGQSDSPALPRKLSTGMEHMTSEDATPEVVTKAVTKAQPSPAPVTGGETKASTKEPVAAENIAADSSIDITAKSQTTTSLDQRRPSIQRQPSTLKSTSVSNAVESDPNVPTDVPMALSVVKEFTSALNRQSLATGAQDNLTAEKTVGNLDSNTAPDLSVRQPKPIGLRRQVSAPRRINNIAAKLAPQAETSEAPSVDVPAKPASNARIANPASRGRKAALASHAAGQVPQRILPPTQPALMVPVSTADLAMTPIEQAPREPERSKKKMTFPGFQSARSDGPWSREAFDLLETGRPE